MLPNGAKRYFLHLKQGSTYVILGCPTGRGLHEAHPSLAMRPSPMLSFFLRHRFTQGGRTNDRELDARRELEARAREALKAEYARANPERTSLTDESVDAIGWQALQLGLQPTMELIRDVAGGGSPTHIHPLIKRFYGRLIDRHFIPAPPVNVPPEVQAFWEQVLTLARREAELQRHAERTALETEREAFATTVAEHQAQHKQKEAELAAAHAELEQEREQREATERERARYVSHLEAQVAEATRERNEARDIAAGHEALIQRLEAEAAAAREGWAAQQKRTEAELARTREAHSALAATERDQLQALARIESERDALAAARKDLADRLAQLQREATAEREAAERRVAAAQAEAEARTRDQARWFESHQQTVAELERARRALDDMRAGTEALRGKLEAVQSDLAAQQQTLAAVRAAQSAVLAERDRLAVLVARLSDSRSEPAKGGRAS